MPESLLSGVNRHFPEGSMLCYQRRFRLPQGFNKGRVLLHFGAVDQYARVFINDKPENFCFEEAAKYMILTGYAKSTKDKYSYFFGFYSHLCKEYQ